MLPEVEVAAGEIVRERDGVLQALAEEEQQFVEDAVQRALLGLWFGCDEDEKRRGVALRGPGRQLTWATKVLSTKLTKRKGETGEWTEHGERERKRRVYEAGSAKKLQGWIGYSGGSHGKLKVQRRDARR